MPALEPEQHEEARADVAGHTALAARLALERTAPNEFMGDAPQIFERRIFGGHLLAQALLAAADTVDTHRLANSLHAYFLRTGRPEEEVRYSVSHIRDGGSLSIRSVRAYQDDEILMIFTASFLKNRRSEEVHFAVMPTVPDAEDLAPLHERHSSGRHPPDGVNWPTEWNWWASSRPLDIRYVDDSYLEDPSLRCFWFRAEPTHGAVQNVQRAIMAFASDRSLLPSIAKARGELRERGGRRVASVDHAMWFHADVNVGEWHLYVQDSPFSTSGLGLARGLVYSRSGAVVASVTQQGVL